MAKTLKSIPGACNEQWMVLFQDEPEERLPQKRSLFGPEPDERAASRDLNPPSGRSVARKTTQPVLFGDQPEEASHHSQPAHASSSSSSKVQPQQSTLNIDWSAMQLFSQATFLKKAVEVTKQETPKRHYDNSNRERQAAPSQGVSFKDNALDPSRLQALKNEEKCNCAFVAASVQLVFW